jgi:hypothetical protein
MIPMVAGHFWMVGLLTLWPAGAVVQPEQARKEFLVKQVAGGFVYLDGGEVHGLREGMRLTLNRRNPGEARMAERRIADAVIVATASQSALAEIRDPAPGLAPAVGDTAVLQPADAEAVARMQASSARKRYAQVVSFTSGDPLEEEIREYVPMKPPSEVGRLQGRLGFEWNALHDRDSGFSSHQEGIALRIDWTRIEGTFWNVSGYWRGRWNSRHGSGQGQTLVDLVNRTYTLGLYYENPRSKHKAGFGRVLLPWASSLSTIDGGYYARKMGKRVTSGIFAGSTPDPTQWNYDPNRQLLGIFTSGERGSFDKVRWTGTVGAAVSRVRWRPERNFLFVENSLYAGEKFSLLHSMEADLKNARLMGGARGAMLSRSFLTLRVQPSRRFSVDLNQNYFRGLPTFDTSLLGTGLLDKFLFQGFSGGFRALPLERLSISANWGRSSREGDERSSLNQMYSIGYNRLPWIDARAEARYTRFSSSFGSGSYKSLSLVRNLGENLRLELMGGQQEFSGTVGRPGRSRFLDARADWDIGLRYFLSGGWLYYQGSLQNYQQMMVTLGYRF